MTVKRNLLVVTATAVAYVGLVKLNDCKRLAMAP